MEIHAGLCRLLPRLHRPAGPIGLEAQRSAVAGFVGVRELVAEFTEVESGKRADRPQLAAALDLCRRRRAMLVIAKLDRLARNVAFIANLMESGVEFTAVDMPSANKLTLHILSAVAEHKREMISARTKAALAAGARRDVGPTRPGDPAHARGPIGQPRRLARCRTQPGNRFGPWTEAAYGTRCRSVPLVQPPRPCRRTSLGQGWVRDQSQTSQQWFSWGDAAGRPSSPGTQAIRLVSTPTPRMPGDVAVCCLPLQSATGY
jgi:DNA invertase Pin-like site-specific DNA recombinase